MTNLYQKKKEKKKEEIILTATWERGNENWERKMRRCTEALRYNWIFALEAQILKTCVRFLTWINEFLAFHFTSHAYNKLNFLHLHAWNITDRSSH